QKKVEERNFSIRKHLLEYDEVMDHQRQVFYNQRQQILESTLPGRSEQLIDIISKMIDQSIEAACRKYLAPEHPAQCMADWIRTKLECQMEPKDLVDRDFESMESDIRQAALDETRTNISMQVGEYMDPEVPPDQWDIRGLATWAATRFGGSVSQNQLRKMSAGEGGGDLQEAPEEKDAGGDLTPVPRLLEPDF